MTNILSLFRRKTTYIYTIILTVIITVVILFWSFYNYYNHCVNRKFLERGYVFVISHNDYTEEIKKYDGIVSIQDGILLKPNFENEFMGISPVANGDESEEETEEEHLVYWDEVINGGYDNILVIDYDENLKKDEVILYQDWYDYTEEDIEKIIGNNISVYFEEELIKLKINNIVKENKIGMKISKELFDELLEKQTLNVKIIKVSNYSTVPKLVLDFYKKETNKDYHAYYVIKNLEEENYIDGFIILIDTFNTASIFLICAFIIIFAIVVKNIIVDQKDNIKMKRFLGYKRINIKTELICNFIIISIIAHVISYLSSSIIILILNSLLKYNMKIIDTLLLIKLVGVTTILSIVLILLFNIKQHNGGGENNEV